LLACVKVLLLNWHLPVLHDWREHRHFTARQRGSNWRSLLCRSPCCLLMRLLLLQQRQQVATCCAVAAVATAACYACTNTYTRERSI
jgi:hypothetical protein